jgi:uncharacterized protein YpbB
VIGFTESRLQEGVIEDQLRDEQVAYISHSLIKSFDWSKLVEQLRSNFEEYAHRQIPDKIKAIELGKQWLDKAMKQQDTAVKFSRQLEQLLQTAASDEYSQLQQRMQAACGYFVPAIEEDLVKPLQEHVREIKVKKKAKKYVQTLLELKLICIRKKQQLEDALQMVSGLQKGVDTTDLLSSLQEKKKNPDTGAPGEHTGEGSGPAPGEGYGPASGGRPKKGDTNRISLQMHKEGVSITDISSRRGLARTTIESHLASFIPTGEIDIKDLVPAGKIAPIIAAIEDVGGSALGPIKGRLGDDYSFGEIRSVMYYLRHTAKQESNP